LELEGVIVRVFVSVDIEGVAGVVGREEGSAGNPEYERARRLMTAEASAAVRGVLAAQPDAEVTVADAHGTFRNIIPELLDARARLVRGKPRPLAMIEGVQEGVDAAIFVGYHGRSGTGDSVLSHTFTGTLGDVRVNGVSFGEIGLNAAVAGAYGVPVVLVTGDVSVDAEVEALLPGTKTAVVKRGIGALAADGVHPERACALIEEAANAALSDRIATTPFVVNGEVSLEVDVLNPVFVDQALIIPGIRRVAGRTLAYDAPDYLTAYRVTRLIAALSGLPV
jgi:D-amino peptidase